MLFMQKCGTEKKIKAQKIETSYAKVSQFIMRLLLLLFKKKIHQGHEIARKMMMNSLREKTRNQTHLTRPQWAQAQKLLKVLCLMLAEISWYFTL